MIEKREALYSPDLACRDGSLFSFCFSISTARLEMAAIRGLFAYMIRMDAVDVIFNPAANVKIKRPEGRVLFG